MPPKHALEGIKVADFSWVVTAPLATTILAQHGAEVVKVESMTAPDLTRPYAPYKDGIPGVNRGCLFFMFNKSKYSLALNLRKPQGIEIAKRLVVWSDVVVESFMPGRMDSLGLGYEELKRIKPDIIMVSTSMLGETGPYSRHTGLGSTLQALVGFNQVCGWPDRAPTFPYGAYTDFTGPFFIVIAIIAALEQRQRTGEGQYIDVSQFESALSFLSPVILDYTTNQRVQGRRGNRSTSAAPHGIYRCKGDDRWCAITVSNDEEWEGFCEVIGKPDWTKDAKFITLLSRLENVDELDKLVEEWTINFAPQEIMTKLQAARVPATVVANGQDISEDSQLRSTGFYKTLKHAEMGETNYEALSFTLSETPAELKPDPCLGQDTEYVCTKILGMSDEEFVQLLADDALQ